MPTLPVYSTMAWAGWSGPPFSSNEIAASAIVSFMLPVGSSDSSLEKMRAQPGRRDPAVLNPRGAARYRPQNVRGRGSGQGASRGRRRFAVPFGTSYSSVVPEGQRTETFTGGLEAGAPKKQTGLDWLEKPEPA